MYPCPGAAPGGCRWGDALGVVLAALSLIWGCACIKLGVCIDHLPKIIEVILKFYAPTPSSKQAKDSGVRE